MPIVTPTAEGDGARGQPEQHEVDITAIAVTVQEIREPRRAPPPADRVAALMGRVRGHIGLLLAADLGPDDAPRRHLSRQAEAMLAARWEDDSPAGQWEHARDLALVCRDLLRLYEIHRPL
jgi:Family of unknown function (DUF6415)